jgi:hypothetical protein
LKISDFMDYKQLIITVAVASIVLFVGLSVTSNMMENDLPKVIEYVNGTCNLCLQQFPESNCTYNSPSVDLKCSELKQQCEKNCTIYLV